MSLINKMLQDLDARRVQHGGAADPVIKPMARASRRSASTIVTSIAAVLAGGLMIAGSIAAWRFYEQRQSAVPVPQKPSVMMVNAAAPAAVRPAATPAVMPTVTPVAAAVQAAPAPQPEVQAPAPQRAPVQQPAQEEAVLDEPAPEPVRPAPKPPAPSPAKRAKAVVVEETPAPAPVQGRVMSAQQRAEGDYRRATAALQEGRVREAIERLQDALEAEPRHDAARQTLVRLLIEARRGEDAMRVLQAGLVLDPRQPAMAMLLARLQIEHGGTGIETLQRSLPYAKGDADYEGFLAGALQRAARHREAIEQYQAAVRSEPGNGIWWMGLGISLQAEKRAAEAADAYARALSSGALTGDLRTFVERRLEQVRR
ncbi:tetratricopeptide repeat protein [Pseudoduganella sp. GCM10020061]|uniref:tetratricopeptide repeat protein n=1 Tax=Pseudoduganella sp. GCM10020061 TaxID=3317345 RepID=UPI00362A207C